MKAGKAPKNPFLHLSCDFFLLESGFQERLLIFHSIQSHELNSSLKILRNCLFYLLVFPLLMKFPLLLKACGIFSKYYLFDIYFKGLRCSCILSRCLGDAKVMIPPRSLSRSPTAAQDLLQFKESG